MFPLLFEDLDQGGRRRCPGGDDLRDCPPYVTTAARGRRRPKPLDQRFRSCMSLGPYFTSPQSDAARPLSAGREQGIGGLRARVLGEKSQCGAPLVSGSRFIVSRPNEFGNDIDQPPSE